MTKQLRADIRKIRWHLAWAAALHERGRPGDGEQAQADVRAALLVACRVARAAGIPGSPDDAIAAIGPELARFEGGARP